MTYRYRLDRVVDASLPRTVMYVGINPSTADATNDDATVRKWKGFTRRLGCGRFVVGNVFAYRTTDVRALQYVAYPVGMDNSAALHTLMLESDIIVPCWGDRGKVPARLREQIDYTYGLLVGHATATGKPMYRFGRTKNGDPKHPLMLGYDTNMERIV